MGNSMLKLFGNIKNHIFDDNLFVNPIKISTNSNLPNVLKKTYAYLIKDNNYSDGFFHYIVFNDFYEKNKEILETKSYSIISDDFKYLSNDDIVSINTNQNKIRVLFRSHSDFNSILVTEQCNHYCLMCSQPPKSKDDSYLLDEIENLIPLIPRYTKEIGFTGGEPTTNRDRFLKILRLTKSYLPETSIHILSNGRSFRDFRFAKSYADLELADSMVGIPLYSDDPSLHNYIVQADNAFDETVQGIINLKKLNQKVEIRIVLHKLSIERLIQLCEFIGRNLLFVDHVALMGLEIIGFTRANLQELWIDPFDYKDKLSQATFILKSYGLNASIYNHQLCVVNENVWPFCRQSISDWKNEFAIECQTCTKRCDCGGFFSSGLLYKHSDHLHSL